MTFTDLGLSPKVLSAVTDAGYIKPTPIQAGAIPHALLGKDVLVVGLRTEQGTPVDQVEHGINTGGSKLASILLAIPQTDEEIYSAAIASSTFVLTLSTD